MREKTYKTYLDLSTKYGGFYTIDVQLKDAFDIYTTNPCAEIPLEPIKENKRKLLLLV